MSEKHVTPSTLARELRKDLRALSRRVKSAVRKTAKQGAEVCRTAVPTEFEEIAAGIIVVDGKIIRSTAPHSDPVERGARGYAMGNRLHGGNLPEPRDLIEYIRKHGSGRGKVGKGVRRALKRLEIRGKRGVGRHSDINAPRNLAYAILNSLKKHQRPYRFMQAPLPIIQALLNTNVEAALTPKAAAAAPEPQAPPAQGAGGAAPGPADGGASE